MHVSTSVTTATSLILGAYLTSPHIFFFNSEIHKDPHIQQETPSSLLIKKNSTVVMKFSLLTVAISFPLVNGFASPKGGFVSQFFRDRTSDSENASFFSRFGKPVMKKLRDEGGLEDSTSEDENVWWNVKEDGIIGYVATEDMTGVSTHMTQLCSTISSQLYSKEKFEDFKLSTKDHKTEALIYDDHGIFKASTVPFLVAVCGDTMILGWR